MCGIAGYASFQPLDGRAMIEALAHRGPDSRGLYRTHVGDREVCLAHARLSIIDLSEAGRQPMADPYAGTTITYNGEVYNFQALRERHLGAHRFRSQTDTEVLLYLYRAFGPSFVDHLNGDFAFALLDEPAGLLYLCRDRMGVKPLYYTHGPHGLAFASEVKALLAGGVEVTLSEESLHRYFVFKYVPGNDTLHAEVKRLPPGTLAAYDLRTNRLTLERYWSPAPEAVAGSYRAQQRRLYDLLEDATRMRLVSDVPVGTFFSGGVDSSTLAYFIRDQRQITHYCARKTAHDLRREGTTSDYDHAVGLARAWGLRLETIDIGAAETTRARIRQTVYYADDLIADGSQIPSYLIAEAAARTSRVMLSGMGADELFLGYAGHQLALLAGYFDRLPGALTTPLMQALGRLPQGRGRFKAYRRYLHKLGAYYGRPELRYGAFSIVGDLDAALRLSRRTPEAIAALLEGYFAPGTDPFETLTRFEMDHFLVKNLHYLDRMCMAHGIEGRVPFMDHRIVAFALGLRRNHRLAPWGTTKRILKDAMRGALPASILRRRKAGFGMPLRSLFGEAAQAEALIDVDFFGGFDFFDVDEIRRSMQAHLSGEEDQSALLYALVSFQEWYSLFQRQEAVA